MILPWHSEIWSRLAFAGERSHHALLLAGSAGGGKRQFAEALAASRLCDTPDEAGHACNHCESCVWIAAGTHPDLFRLVPESEEAGDEGADDKEAARSRQIKVEQVRSLQEALVRKGHRSERRVVIVDPAESMNAVTANGLLKLLEEPPSGVLFLLISRSPERLIPTLRSRSQRWDFTAPPVPVARQWLAEQGVADGANWLGFASGMPLAAQQIASGPLVPLRLRFVRDLASLPARDPLALAGEWDACLRLKDSQSAGFDMPCLADWLQRWTFDLASAVQGAPVRFFPDAAPTLEELARKISEDQALACYNDSLNLRRVAAHPLNARLLLEDTLIRYCRHFHNGK